MAGPLFAATLLSRSASAILKQLSKTPAHLLSSERSLLFALSTNVSNTGLSSLVEGLTTSCHGQHVGCLSAAIPTLGYHDLISCSIAIFDRQQTRAFRSTIVGKPSPQVGRWHAFRNRNDDKARSSEPLGDVDSWNSAWSRSYSSELPKDLEGISHDSVSDVIYFTDEAPEGLSNALTAFKRPNKIGLFASPTPFVTGRPVTLFKDGSIHGTGAVGLATISVVEAACGVKFSSLRAISDPLEVTKSEGNLVHELRGGNAAKLLISAVQNAGLEQKDFLKDDDFYLGVLSGNIINSVYRITSGGPSRGTIALESNTAPGIGSTVKLLHRPAEERQQGEFSSTMRKEALGRTLQFVSADEYQELPVPGEGEVSVAENSFIAAGEGGFILSRGAEHPWRSATGGAALSWNPRSP